MHIDEKIFFRQVTLRICSSLDIEKALIDCLSYLNNFIPASDVFLNLFEPGLGIYRNLVTVSHAGSKKPFPPAVMSKKAIRQIEFEYRKWQEVRIVDQPELHPVAKILFPYAELSKSSGMIMSMVIEDKRLGTLGFLAKGRGRFKKKHAHLVSLLREPLAIAVSNAIRYQEVLKLKDMIDAENLELRQELRYLDKIVGADHGLKGVMEIVQQVASLNTPIMLLGETGVGKEVIANVIHSSSPRKEGPFIKVNCGAIPESLLDSELFGHERGAFTGAIAQKKGRFERADKGSIFLDEIAELPPSAQVRLLRVLQNKEIERVGGTTTVAVDVRAIAATHRNLEEMVRAGKFREDLWFRLNIFPVMIPPLRHRKIDIPPLVHHFIEKKSNELRMHTPPPVSTKGLERLMAYHWPGNVRELENLIERELIRSRGSNGKRPLTFEHFQWPEYPDDRRQLPEANRQLLKLDEAMSRHIQQALSLAEGKIYGADGAAQLLGINPNTLRSRMRKLGVSFRTKKGNQDNS